MRVKRPNFTQIAVSEDCTLPEKRPITSFKQYSYNIPLAVKLLSLYTLVSLLSIVVGSKSNKITPDGVISNGNSASSATSSPKEGSFYQQDGFDFSNYCPQGSIGIRFKKTVLQVHDLHYVGIASHIQETYMRKKEELAQFSDSQTLPINDSEQGLKDIQVSTASSTGPYQSDNTSTENEVGPKAYLSTNYYKPKTSFIENPLNKDEVFPHGGIQFQTQGVPNLGGVGGGVFPSIGGPQGGVGGDTYIQQEFPKDNSYLNFALNIKTAYELPVERMESIEKIQIIEGFLQKRAKHHSLNNFNEIKAIFETDRISSGQNFGQVMYTFEEPSRIANLTDGIRPMKIQDLKQKNPAFRLFTQSLEIFPSTNLNFEEREMLIPKMEIVKLTSKQKKPLLVKGFFTSSPELTIYMPENLELPYILKPDEQLDIKVILMPETLGLFEGLIYIAIEDSVFIESVTAFIVKNMYDMAPIYLTDVSINEKVEVPLYISNTLQSETMIIQEIYSTEEYLQLKWPNGIKVQERIDSISSQEGTFSSYLKIAPKSRKHIMTLTFQEQVPEDYVAMIHIRTSASDILRVPVYIHLHSDFVKVTPTLVDFGIVGINFDQLKVAVKIKFKTSDQMIINDIYVPIYDSRLDFLMIEAKRLNQGKPIKKNQDIFLGYALLNPTSSGMIDTNLIIVVSQSQSNKTYQINVPVIGMILNQTTVLAVNPQSTSYESSNHPIPLTSFNVAEYMINDTNSRMLFKIPQFKPAVLIQQASITNTFQKPILYKGIISKNPEFRISNNYLDIFTSNNQIMIQSNQSISLAQISLHTSQLLITQGAKFVSLQINNTLVSMQVMVYDKSLLCVWEEEYQQFRFIQCGQGYEINFGNVAVNEPKYKKLNITNMNPMEVVIENILKSQIDDMTIYLDRIIEKNGKVTQYGGTVSENSPVSENVDSNTKKQQQPLITPKRTKKQISLSIMPYQTIVLVFQVQSKEPKNKSSKIEFQTKNKEFAAFSFNYNYNVIEGQISLTPSTVKYNPSFQGILQHKQIVAKSTFDIPIVIKQVKCNDVRILPKLHNTVIMPRNRTDIATLTFDPSKTTPSLVFNDVDMNNLFTGTMNQLDPTLQQNLMQAFNGQLPGGPNAQFTMLTNQPNFNGPTNNLFKGNLVASDLFQWRQRQAAWEKLGTNGQTEINATFTIETNVIQSLQIPVKAYLMKPTIVPEENINFELVQVGQVQTRGIRIYNPSDEVLMLQLYIAPSSFSLNSSQLVTKNPQNNPVRVNNQKNQKETFLNTYCNAKLNQKVITKEILEGSHEAQNNKIQREILIGSKQNTQELCMLIKQNMSDSQVIKQNLEHFFREMHAQEAAGEGIQVVQSQQQQQMVKNLMNAKQNAPPGVHFSLPSIMQQQNQENNKASQEFEEQIDKIMEWSTSKPIDQRISQVTGNTNNDHSVSPIHELYGFVKETVKKVFGEKTIRQKLNVTQQQQQLRPTYKVKNIEIDSSNETQHQDIQHFYINPKYQGQIFKVEPKQNLTINDAVLYQPRQFSDQSHSAAILIKNNITTIYPVNVEGNSGTGLIEFVKVYKKTGDQLINTNNYQNDIFTGLNNNMTSIKQNRERIHDFIFNDAVEKNSSYQQVKQRSDSQVLNFLINLEDIIIQDGQQDLLNQSTRQFENLNAQNFPTHNLRINNIHRRMFVAKNTGDLPVVIDAIYIKDRGCQGYGFTIENCQSFSLKPGEHHYIHINYETDFSIAKVRKTFVLEGKNFIQTFQIQAQMPIRYLQMAHQLGQLNQFEETTHSTMQQALLLLAAITIAFVYREVISHYKKSVHFLEYQKNRISGKKLAYVAEIDESKIITTLSKQNNQYLKEQIVNDQILSQYQQVQEKYNHPHQLLFKELANICSKKSLILLEAQKQALEAEKERKQANKQTYNNQHQHFQNQSFFEKSDDFINIVGGGATNQKDYTISKGERKAPANQKIYPQTHNKINSSTSSHINDATQEQKAVDTKLKPKQNDKKQTQITQIPSQQLNEQKVQEPQAPIVTTQKVESEDEQKIQPIEAPSTHEEHEQKSVIVPKKILARLNKKQRKEELARQRQQILKQNEKQEQTVQSGDDYKSENDHGDDESKQPNEVFDNQSLEQSENKIKNKKSPSPSPLKNEKVKIKSPSPSKQIKERLKTSEKKDFSGEKHVNQPNSALKTKNVFEAINLAAGNEDQLMVSENVTPIKNDLNPKDDLKSKSNDPKNSLSMSFEVIDNKSNKLSNSIENISKKSHSYNNDNSQDQQQLHNLDNSIHSSELNEDPSVSKQYKNTHTSIQSSSQTATRNDPSQTSYTRRNYREQQTYRGYSGGQQQQPTYSYKTRGSQYQQQTTPAPSYYNASTYYNPKGRVQPGNQETSSFGQTYGYRNNQTAPSATSYVKRNVGGVMGRTNYHNYDEENSQDNISQYQMTNTTNQPSVRKVINTMKPTTIPTQTRSRGRGMHYRMSSEYEDESGDHNIYGQSSGMYQKRQRQDQNSAGTADEYANYNYEYGSGANKGYVKKSYNRKPNTDQSSYYQDQYEQEEPNIEIEDVEPVTKKQKADISVASGDVTYGSFVNDLEFTKNQPPTAKLSKTELAPFFEKQKIEKSEDIVQKLRMQTISPTSGSLFAFQNPHNQLSSTMNIASQGGSATTIIKESQDVVKKQIHDLLEENEDSEEDEEEEEKTLGTDFYNAFKSASSLFSKPLFGDKQEEKRSRIKNQSNIDSSLVEENPSDEEVPSGASLFSGSLFGGGSLFGQRNTTVNMAPTPKDSKYAIHDASVYEEAEAEEASPLNELRQGSKPVLDSYSLFGNMNYIHPDSASSKKAQSFWGGKHFQEDDEEFKSEDDDGDQDQQQNKSQAKGYNLFG